jgi:hypothetical protein
MVESRFFRHLASFGIPRGAGFFALGLETEGGGAAFSESRGLPNEKVRTADSDDVSGGLAPLKSENERRLSAAGAGAFVWFAPFAAR